MSMTYPTNNDLIKTPQTSVINITQPGWIQYTVFVEKSCHCAGDIMIVANDREIDVKTVLFSKS